MTDPETIQPAQVDLGILDRYEVAAHSNDEGGAIVSWHCPCCNLVQVIARDLDGNQADLTLGDLAQAVIEHEQEAHQ